MEVSTDLFGELLVLLIFVSDRFLSRSVDVVDDDLDVNMFPSD